MPRDRYDDEAHRPRRRSRPRDNDDDLPRRPARRRNSDDDDDEPRPTGTNGLATASLVFGVLSFCTGITFLPGLLCGFMGLMKAQSVGSGKGMAIAGIVCSAGGLIVSAALGFGGYLLYEKNELQMSSRRTEANYHQIGLAGHNYSDTIGGLPKAYCEDPMNPRPVLESELSSKLSWRVSVLPYLEQDSLYRRFRVGESWDSSTNKPLSQTVVPHYADGDTPLDPTTRLRCFYGNGAAFELNQRVMLSSFLDGTSNTILYVEGGDKVTWSQFNEYKFAPNVPLPALGHPKRDTFTVVMADGWARQVRKSVNPAVLKAAITRNGGEVLFLD